MYFNSVISSPQHVTSGVPQGSILGPLPFILYVNDMQHVLHISSILMYADDTVVFTSGPTTNYIEEVLNSEFENILCWLQSNEMIIHPTKTECMLFGTHQRLVRAPSLTIRIGTKTVRQEFTYNYLGVHLHSGLTFEEHVNKMAKKVSRRLFLCFNSYISLFNFDGFLC